MESQLQGWLWVQRRVERPFLWLYSQPPFLLHRETVLCFGAEKMPQGSLNQEQQPAPQTCLTSGTHVPISASPRRVSTRSTAAQHHRALWNGGEQGWRAASVLMAVTKKLGNPTHVVPCNPFQRLVKWNTRKAKDNPNPCLLAPSGCSLGEMISLCRAADLLGRFTSQTWAFPTPASVEKLSLDQVWSHSCQPGAQQQVLCQKMSN